VLLVEQNVTFASTVADRHVLLAQGRVVERLDNDEFAQRKGELLDYLGL
jgi:branched-chain amino acid transport system ATP-binding protein